MTHLMGQIFRGIIIAFCVKWFIDVYEEAEKEHLEG
jgi:hypothetical protein